MMNNFGFKTQTQFLDILGDNSRVVVIIFLDIVPRLLLVLAQVMYGGEFQWYSCLMEGKGSKMSGRGVWGAISPL